MALGRALKVFSIDRARTTVTFALVGLLLFSGYGTLVPASTRCALPGEIGCSGGILGAPVPGANATYTQWFNVTMYDYGFWIINTVDGTNQTNKWYMYEGWTIHINATSLKADPSQGGTAYHGIGIELNATGKQLLSLAARVGVWASGSFVAPTSAYSAQRIWCTVECGPGHGGQHMNNVYIVAPTFVPSVTVAADQTSGSAPLTVAFTGTISGGTAPFNTSWTFGDGGKAYQANTTHTYTSSGKYSALLSVLDAKNFRASHNISIQVKAITPLTGSASAAVTTGWAPLGVTFSASASGGTTPYTFRWDFGDGGAGTGTAPFHLYTAAGSYGVVATIKDAGGLSTTALVSIGVHEPTGQLGVTATATPSTGAAPAAIALSAAESGGTAPYSVVWIFGDGSAGTGASASHTYSTVGAYEPTAFVTDSAGAVGMAAVAVSISGPTGSPLVANLLETPSAGSPPLTIAASASVMGGSGSYPTVRWGFGDGATLNGATVAHVYPNVGHYNVSVTVTDSLGTIASQQTQVRVAGLAMTISVSPTSGDAPLNVSGSASIQGGTGLYGPVAWTWGDGTISSGSPKNHSYGANVTGTLTIRAQVNDSTGTVATATANVTIVGGPVAQVTADVAASSIFPVSANFSLNVTGGTGSYSPSPLWDFGDGATTRGPSPQGHQFFHPGTFHVVVTTNDSSGVVATASTWVNLSAGSPAGAQGGGGGPPEWAFNGVANPDQAALALMGFVAGTGLAMLLYKRFVKGHQRAPSTSAPPRVSHGAAPKIPTASGSSRARTPPF